MQLVAKWWALAGLLAGISAIIVLCIDAQRIYRPCGACKSRFFAAYNPSLGVENFARPVSSAEELSRSYTSHGIHSVRSVRLHTKVEAKRLPVLLQAIQRNINDTLVKTRTYSRQTAMNETYQQQGVSGVVRVLPVYRDSAGAFVIPLAIEEQWFAR